MNDRELMLANLYYTTKNKFVTDDFYEIAVKMSEMLPQTIEDTISDLSSLIRKGLLKINLS